MINRQLPALLKISVFVLAILISPSALAFEDDDGCLLCHKYPKMGRITEDGARRSYYILPHVFEKTVHRNVPCKDCHSYIKQLPHREVKTGVTCNAECHSIKNPATGKNFSHKSIYDKYMQSSHSREKVTNGTDQDKPYCVTCHTNPIYNPDELEGPPKRITQRCVVCHEDETFVANWYKHTSRRIQEVKRSPKEVNELCSSCHGDKRLIERHLEAAKKEGRELGVKYPYAAESYDDSFHGKVTRYGFKGAASCLDCHADNDNYYMNVHDIKPSRDPDSPVNKENVVKTCQRCHTYADENYAQLDPHPTPMSHPQDNPFRYYANVIYGWVGDVVLLLLVGLAAFETLGRRRDGVTWRLRKGSSWWRRSKRGRDRVK
jgi:hypothetical protein